MGITRTEIVIAKEVAGTTEEYDDSFVPATGDFWIVKFCGDAAFNTNCAVKLVWDFGGAGEEVLWVTKGHGDMPAPIKRTGNASKKLAVTLDNGLGGAVFMAGYAEIRQET